MAKKKYIKSFISNLDLKYLNMPHHGQWVSSELKTTKNHLESTIRLLNRWNDARPASCEMEFEPRYENFYIDPEEAVVFQKHIIPGCDVSFDRFDKIFDNLIITHSDLDQIYSLKDLDSYSISKYISRRDKIAKINEELRILRQELRKRFSQELLQKVRDLVHELHSIVSFYFKKQYKHVNRLKEACAGFIVRDIRNFLRQTVQIIFKNLPDFSGCEEEARFNSIVNSKPLCSFYNLEKSCTTQHFWSIRWIQ